MESIAPIVALVFSAVALAISGITAYLTFFRRGKLRMTRPSLIFFGYDTTPDHPDPKVFLRGLLFSTSKRGQVIENLYLRLTRGESVQNFSGWFHGDPAKLSVGGGLFVGQDGVTTNHHFMLAPDQNKFAFQSGSCLLQVFGNVFGNEKSVLLFEVELSVSEDHAQALQSRDSGLHFNWGPESRKYYAYIDKRPERPLPQELLSMIARSDEKSVDKEAYQ